MPERVRFQQIFSLEEKSSCYRENKIVFAEYVCEDVINESIR